MVVASREEGERYGCAEDAVVAAAAGHGGADDALSRHPPPPFPSPARFPPRWQQQQRWWSEKPAGDRQAQLGEFLPASDVVPLRALHSH